MTPTVAEAATALAVNRTRGQPSVRAGPRCSMQPSSSTAAQPVIRSCAADVIFRSKQEEGKVASADDDDDELEAMDQSTACESCGLANQRRPALGRLALAFQRGRLRIQDQRNMATTGSLAPDMYRVYRARRTVLKMLKNRCAHASAPRSGCAHPSRRPHPTRDRGFAVRETEVDMTVMEFEEKARLCSPSRRGLHATHCRRARMRMQFGASPAREDLAVLVRTPSCAWRAQFCLLYAMHRRLGLRTPQMLSLCSSPRAMERKLASNPLNCAPSCCTAVL